MVASFVQYLEKEGAVKVNKRMTFSELDTIYEANRQELRARGIEPMSEEEITDIVDEVRQEHYDRGLHNPKSSAR